MLDIHTARTATTVTGTTTAAAGRNPAEAPIAAPPAAIALFIRLLHSLSDTARLEFEPHALASPCFLLSVKIPNNIRNHRLEI